jgi:hypothetical protein
LDTRLDWRLVIAALVGRTILRSSSGSSSTSLSSTDPTPSVSGAEGALFVHSESVESIRSADLTKLEYADLRALLIAKGFQNVGKYRPERFAA